MTNLQNNDIDSLGHRIVSAREAMDLTTAQLARRLGVKTATLSGWETDRSEPRANRLATLAAMTNVSLIWLLTGEGEGPSEHSLDADLSQLKVRLDQLKAQANDMAAEIEAIAAQLERAGRRNGGAKS